MSQATLPEWLVEYLADNRYLQIDLRPERLAFFGASDCVGLCFITEDVLEGEPDDSDEDNHRCKSLHVILHEPNSKDPWPQTFEDKLSGQVDDWMISKRNTTSGAVFIGTLDVSLGSTSVMMMQVALEDDRKPLSKNYKWFFDEMKRLVIFALKQTGKA